MNNKQRTHAVLNYKNYDRLPVVHFGFWQQTLEKWASQGHINSDLLYLDNPKTIIDKVARLLGFDFGWMMGGMYSMKPISYLYPPFERKILKKFDNGSMHVLNAEGTVELEKPGVESIKAEIDHLLKNRTSYEEHFKWRLQWSSKRVTEAFVYCGGKWLRFDRGGREYLISGKMDYPYGLNCGSLIGIIRCYLGLTGLSYMQVDDTELLDEIIDDQARIVHQNTEYLLQTGIEFDYGHFWEDICFNGGPLVSPDFFKKKIAPHYKRITELFHQHNIDLISVDCDGKIDELIPIWLENGVNVMFPVEVGSWQANIGSWRKKYGRAIKAVGGVKKSIFGQDKKTVDQEIDRLRPLVDLGGYIPCPDHYIPPDADWSLVKYYCERMRSVFGGT